MFDLWNFYKTQQKKKWVKDLSIDMDDWNYIYSTTFELTKSTK